MSTKNIETPLDAFGQLVEPRREGESLYDYRHRLEIVAEVMLKRDLTPNAEEPSWVEARERELEGRTGMPLDLIQAPYDEQLIERGESKVLSYDELEDREGPFRWPRVSARGTNPFYGWAQSEKGGVSTPDSLMLSERDGAVYAQPGYIDVEGQYYYVGAHLKSTTLALPEGTQETVIVPWDIATDHPHRIEIVDRETLAFVGTDHTHHINYLGEQLGYMNEGRAVHEHDITRHHIEGPAFAVTTEAGADTALSSPTGVYEASGVFVGNRRVVPVPSLQPVNITVGEHEVTVSPHDFWRGHFSLIADDHTHQVREWEVQEAAGHTHDLRRPKVQVTRPLVPRLSAYEGNQLLPQMTSPYVLDMRVEDGWVVGRVGDSFSPQLQLFFETGQLFKIPEKHFKQDDKDVTIGLGLADAPVRFEVDVLQARINDRVVLRVRAEDQYTGGVPLVDITAQWENEVPQLVDITKRTSPEGEVVFDIPVGMQPVLRVTLSHNGIQLTETIQIHDLPEEPQGYGYNYGMNYGL